MQLRHRQRGLGLWGWMYFLGTAGIMVMIGIQAVPVYTSEMAIQKVVKAAAQDSGSSVSDLRKSLQTRWDVEGITTMEAKDVKIVQFGQGKALSYDYNATIPLISNASLVLHFTNKYPMASNPAE